MRHTLIAMALLIASTPARADDSDLRVREVDCDQEAVSFRLTKDRGTPADLVSTWDGSQSIWIGEPIDLSVKDLTAFQVIERSSLVFDPHDPNRPNPKTGLPERPIVPAIRFELTAEGAARLDRVVRPRWSVPGQSDRRWVGIAVLIDDRLFLSVVIPPYEEAIPGEQIAELPGNDFDRIVEFIEATPGCEVAAESPENAADATGWSPSRTAPPSVRRAPRSGEIGSYHLVPTQALSAKPLGYGSPLILDSLGCRSECLEDSGDEVLIATCIRRIPWRLPDVDGSSSCRISSSRPSAARPSASSGRNVPGDDAIAEHSRDRPGRAPMSDAV